MPWNLPIPTHNVVAAAVRKGLFDPLVSAFLASGSPSPMEEILEAAVGKDRGHHRVGKPLRTKQLSGSNDASGH